jgi:hypothetical protein
MAEKLVIELDLDTLSLTKSLKKIEGDAAVTGDKMGKGMGLSMGEAFKVGFAATVVQAAWEGIKKTFDIAFQALKHGIDEAVAKENSLSKLGISLSLAGSYSREAMEGFLELSNQMEETSNVADDVSLSMIALSKNMGLTNEQATKTLDAAVNLASTGMMDLETAVISLSKSYSGELGRGLERVVPQLGIFTKQALTAGEAVEFISERFAGSAEAKSKTFSGSITQMGLAWDNLTESLGQFITRNPAVMKVFEAISDTMKSLAVDITNNGGRTLSQLMEVAKWIITGLGVPIELIFNVLKSAFLGIKLIANTAFAIVVHILSGIIGMVETAGLAVAKVVELLLMGYDKLKGTKFSESFAKDVKEIEKTVDGFRKTMKDSSIEVVTDSAKQFGNSLINIFDVAGTSASFTFVDKLQQGLGKLKDPLKGKLPNVAGALSADMVQFETIVNSLAEKLNMPRDKIVAMMTELKTLFGTTPIEAQKFLESIASIASSTGASFMQVEQGIIGIATASGKTLSQASKHWQGIHSIVSSSVNGMISGGLSSLGAALTGAAGGFAAFGKTVLNGIGDFAIQLGTFIITSALGIEALKASITSFVGGWGIAAGIALVVLGGALKSFAGGPAGASSGGGAAGGGVAAGLDSGGVGGGATTTNEVAERKVPVTAVNISVSGIITNPRETAQQISDLLKEGSLANNLYVGAV